MSDKLFVGATRDNLVAVKCPSAFEWGMIQVSDESAGRVKNNAKMYVNKIANKEQIKLSWNAPDGKETSTILQAFNMEYFFVKYMSPLTNDWAIKEFYHGDFSAPVYSWWDGETRYQSIAFNIIER